MPVTSSDQTGFDGPAWTDEAEEGVRPYAVTGGRTKPRHTLRPVTLLRLGAASPCGNLAPEAEKALALCRVEQRSVAEIASILQQPLQVAKIILSDLLDAGALIVAVSDTTSEPSEQLLEAVLVGLRNKFFPGDPNVA